MAERLHRSSEHQAMAREEALREELEETQAVLEETTISLEASKAEIREMRVSHSEELQALTEERDSLSSDLEQLSSSNASSATTASRLERQLKALEKELAGLRAEHEKLQNAAAGLRRGLAAAEQGRVVVQKELDDERARFASIDQHKAAVERKLQKATGSLEALKTESTQVTKQRDVAQRHLTDAKGQITTLEEALRSERDTVATLQEELRSATDSASHLEYWKGEAATAKQSLETEVEAARTRDEAAKAALGDLTLRLDAASQHLSELNDELSVERSRTDFAVNGVREEAYRQRQALMQSALSSMQQLRAHLIMSLTGGALARSGGDRVQMPLPLLVTRAAPVTTSPSRLTSPLPRPAGRSLGGASRASSSRGGAGGLGATSPGDFGAGLGAGGECGTQCGTRPPTSSAEELVTRLQTPTLSSIRNHRGGVRLLRGIHAGGAPGSSPPSPGPHLQVQPPASPVGASSSSLWPAQSAPPTVYTTCYTSNVPALSVLAPPLAPPTRPGASFSMLSPDGRSKSPPLQMVRSHSTPATPGAGLGRLNRRGLSSFASVPAGLFDST